MQNTQTLVKSEIEFLTGKLYNGDLTPVVYELFKDTKDRNGLLCVLQEVTGEHVYRNDTIETEDQKDNHRLSFEEWFSGFQQS